MLTAFVAGVAGGLVYCLPFSSVNVEIVRRGLTAGFLSALAVSLGAIVGDLVWLTVAVLGAELVMGLRPLRAGISGLGAAVLLWLAWAAYRSDRRQSDPVAGAMARAEGDAVAGHARAFALGALLCLANPFAIVVLLAVIESAGAALGAGESSASLYAGILVGAVIYGFLVSGVAAWGRRFVTARALALVDRGAAALFAGLGLWLAWHAWTMVRA